jgi:hypothetical protein
MKRLVLGAAFAIAILFVTANGVGAFELLSPPIAPPTDGSLRCRIFNYAAATKAMVVVIQFLDANDEEITTSLTCSASPAGNNNTSSCFAFGDDNARACRFIVTGNVAPRDVRASVEVLDVLGNQVVALEAH